MRKVLLFMACLVPLNLFAPIRNYVNVETFKPFSYYDVLANAVYKVESKCDSLAYNPLEDAVGGFQIRPIRVKDYNMRTGSNYKLEDFYSLKLSKECFLYYAKIYKDPETIVRRWNGSGSKTIAYWNLVKEQL